MYSLYYQAKIDVARTWFVVGVLRNEDHVAFERAIEGGDGLFEFLVPQENRERFLELMEYFKQHGYVAWFEQQSNRFMKY